MIDVECNYIKLIIKECKVNRFNLFNQVGLVAVAIFSSTPNQLNNQKFLQLQYQMSLDDDTIGKL